MGFICSLCGEDHEGLTRDWAYQLPDDVWAIPKAQRESKARFNTDLCEFGSRHFIRGVLPVPLAGQEDSFRFGAWAEVEEQVFQRYLEIYHADASAEPPRAGVLANALAPYEGSIGAPVLIRFGAASARPQFWLEGDARFRLAAEQRAGIDAARFHEILEILFNPSA